MADLWQTALVFSEFKFYQCGIRLCL